MRVRADGFAGLQSPTSVWSDTSFILSSPMRSNTKLINFDSIKFSQRIFIRSRIPRIIILYTSVYNLIRFPVSADSFAAVNIFTTTRLVSNDDGSFASVTSPLSTAAR
jgi:hypothetical protein